MSSEHVLEDPCAHQQKGQIGAVIRNHHCMVLSVPSTIEKFEADSAASRVVVTITITANPNHRTASSHQAEELPRRLASVRGIPKSSDVCAAGRYKTPQTTP
jgi:hypothetical protein